MIKLIAPMAALMMTGTALAEEAARVPKTVKKIVIVHQDGSERTVDIEAATAGALAMVKCDDSDKRFDSSQEPRQGDLRRPRIVICGKAGGDQLAALEKARARLAQSDDLGVDPRARALAALDAEIARLKAAQ